MLFLAFILRLVWLTFLYLLLAAFPCYRSSEPVNGSPAKTVSIFETFAAATRGCNFSCVANFSLPKYSICLHFCWSDSLFSNSSIYFSRLIVSWLFFPSIFNSLGIQMLELMVILSWCPTHKSVVCATVELQFYFLCCYLCCFTNVYNWV